MQASRVSVEETAQRVAAVKAAARQHGRDIGVYTVGVITCRPTRKEAEDYHHHCAVEQADWSAVDNLLALRKVTAGDMSPEEFAQQRMQFAHGNSGLPIIGDPDDVARTLIELSQAGPDRDRGVAGQLRRRASLSRRRGAASAGARGSAGASLTSHSVSAKKSRVSM